MSEDNTSNLPVLVAEPVLDALYEADETPFEAAVAEHHQFRYVINLDERGLFSASLYSILPDGRDGSAVWNFDTEEAEFLAAERVRVRSGQSVVDYEADFGLLPRGASAIGAGADPYKVDPMDSNVWEFREVDAPTAALLRQRGEVVIKHPGVEPGNSRPMLLWCRDSRMELKAREAIAQVA